MTVSPEINAPSVRRLNAEIEKAGWRELAREQRGTDVLIMADAQGQRARIMALSPFKVAGGVTSAMVDPSIFRVDLGDGDPAPLRWAVWTRSASLSLAEGGPLTESFFVQAVEGTGHLSVSVHGHINLSQNANILAPRVLFEVLNTIETEGRPNLSRDATLSLDPDRPLESALTVQKKDPGMKLLTVGALGLSVGSIAAGAALALTGLLETGLIVAAAGSSSAVPWFVATRQRGKDPGKSLDDTLVDTLKSAEIFDSAKVIGEGRPMPVPAISDLPETGGREATAGVMRSALIRASSSRRPLEAAVSRWIIHWPPKTISECRNVPTSWVVCELTGDERALIQAPDWTRQSRTREDIRWLFTGDEVSRGDLADLLVVLARRTMEQGKAPYR